MQEGFGEDSVSHGGGRVKSRRAARKGKMGPPAHKGWAEKWRKDLKIAGVRVVKDDIHDLASSPSLFQRQFLRLVEMLIQMHLDPGDTRTERDYRLQVKDRLYRFNHARSSLDLHWLPTKRNLFFSVTGSPGSTRERRAPREARGNVPDSAGGLHTNIGHDQVRCIRTVLSLSRTCAVFLLRWTRNKKHHFTFNRCKLGFTH